jgi:epoxyqueuosine reductase
LAVMDPGAAVRDTALKLGFDRVAVARADLPLDIDYERYVAFLDRGLHGSMSWLASHREVRRSLAHEAMFPDARSVICVAQRYAVPDSTDSGILPRIARYARGRDYHNHFRRRLRKLADLVRSLAPGARARPMVDTAPVLERAWAARAGLGFIGKNGLLIVPDMGSWIVLGEVVTNLELPAYPGAALAPRCGRCTRCLDACPTGAFRAPWVLDARRCVSYLTIEHEGPCEPELAARVAPWVFGCDVCQEVCPYNRAPAAMAPVESPFAPLDRWAGVQLADIDRLGAAEWEALCTGTPLRRASLADMKRNALMAAGKDFRSP